MKKFEWSFEQTIVAVGQKRNFIDPNLGFIRQLNFYEDHDYQYLENHVGELNSVLKMPLLDNED